jgi:hypothetical protein
MYAADAALHLEQTRIAFAKQLVCDMSIPTHVYDAYIELAYGQPCWLGDSGKPLLPIYEGR